MTIRLYWEKEKREREIIVKTEDRKKERKNERNEIESENCHSDKKMNTKKD